MADTTYEIKNVNGHYEVYLDGKFYCSTDTIGEACDELENAMERFETKVGV